MSSALPSPNDHGARSDSDFDAPEYEPLSDADFDAPAKKKQKKKVDDSDLPARRAGGTSGGSSRRSSTGMTLRNATLRRRPGRYREPEDMPETKPAWVHKAVPFNPELAKFVSYSVPIDSPTGFAPSLDQYNAHVAAKQADEARRQEAEQKGEKHVARVTARAEVLDGTTKGPRVVHLPPLPQPRRRYEDDSDEETVSKYREKPLSLFCLPIVFPSAQMELLTSFLSPYYQVEGALLWMDLSNCTRWNLIDYQNNKLKSRYGEDLEISDVFRSLHLRLRDIIAFVKLYNKELALYEAYRGRIKATQPADNNLEYYRDGGGVWFVDQLTTHSTTDEEIRQGQEYLRQLGEQNARDLKGWKGERRFFFYITGMEHLQLDYLNEAARNGIDADYGDLTIGSMEWATEKFLQGTGVDEQVAQQEAEARSSGSLRGGGGDQQQQVPPMGLDGQADDDNEEEEEDEVIELTSPFDADFALGPLQPPYYPAAPHTPVGVPQEVMQPIIGFGQGYPAGGGGFGMDHNFDGFGGMPALAGSSDYAFAAMMPQGPTNLNWWQQDPDLGLDAFFGDQFPNAAAAAADPLVPDNVAAAAGMPLGVDASGINNAGYDFAFGFEAGHEMNPFFGDQPPNADAAAPLAPQGAAAASMAPGGGDDDAFGANADFDINRMLDQLRNAVEPLAPAGGAAALPLVDDAFGLDAVGHEMNPAPGAAVAPVVSPVVSPAPDVPVVPDQEDLHDDESGSSQSPPASIVFPVEEWQLHAFRCIGSPSATIDPRLLDITGFAPPLPAAIYDSQRLQNEAAFNNQPPVSLGLHDDMHGGNSPHPVASDGSSYRRGANQSEEEMRNAAGVAADDRVATPPQENNGGGGPAPAFVDPDDDLRFDEEWHASLRPRTYSISRLRGDDPDYPDDFVETMFSKPSQMDQTDDSATGTAAAAAAPVVDPAQDYAMVPTPARGQEDSGENLETAATGSAWNGPAHLAFAETPGGQFGWQQAPQVAESGQFVLQQAPVAETNHAAAGASSSRVPSKRSLDEFTNEPVVATPTSARSRARAHKDTFALESDDDFKGVHVPICEPDDDDYKPKKGKPTAVRKRNSSGAAAAAKGGKAAGATPRKKPTTTAADGEATPQTPKATPAPKAKKVEGASPKRKYVRKKKPDANNNNVLAASVPAVPAPVMPAVADPPPAALMPAMMPQPPAPVMPAAADPSFAALMPAMQPQFPSPPRGYCYVQTLGGWGLFPLDGTAPAGVAAGEAPPALVLPEAPLSKPKSTRRKKKEDEEDGTPEKPKPKRARTKKADAASNKGNSTVLHPLCQKETPVPLPPMLKFPSGKYNLSPPFGEDRSGHHLLTILQIHRAVAREVATSLQPSLRRPLLMVQRVPCQTPRRARRMAPRLAAW